MKPIKAIKRFSFKGYIYEKGEEVKIETLEDLIKLNEKGFIESQNARDYQNFSKEISKPKKL